MSKKSEEGILKNYRSWHQLLLLGATSAELRHQLFIRIFDPRKIPPVHLWRFFRPKTSNQKTEEFVANSLWPLARHNSPSCMRWRWRQEGVGNVKGLSENRKVQNSQKFAWKVGVILTSFLENHLLFRGQEFFKKIPGKFEKSFVLNLPSKTMIVFFCGKTPLFATVPRRGWRRLEMVWSWSVWVHKKWNKWNLRPRERVDLWR